jgi:hypothetical protein
MTTKEVEIETDHSANLTEADCFTCWSAGKVLYKKFNGYTGSEPISDKDKEQARIAARTHEEKHSKKHRIVIYHFKNGPNRKDFTE